MWDHDTAGLYTSAPKTLQAGPGWTDWARILPWLSSPLLRLQAGLAAYGRERRRNAELVHRLQQMHGEQVDVLEMKKRFVRQSRGGGYTQRIASEFRVGVALHEPVA